MKRALLLVPIVAIAAAFQVARTVEASGHWLVVDNVQYQDTKVAGDTIMWETPDSNPQSASFAERNQTWAPGDNGSDHLPCDYGVHWVSNANVLTISGCLFGPPNPTTTTTIGATTSTTTSTTTPPTSTVASTTTPASTTSTSTTLATTTTVSETTPSTSITVTSTSTSPSTVASTTITPSTTPSTTQPPSTASSTIAPATTSTVEVGPPPVPVTTPGALPPTGNGDTGLLLGLAGAMLLGGLVAIAARRRS